MSNFEKTQISPNGIGDVLRSNSLSVPAYQRSYSWDKSNVTQFLGDIISAYQKNEPEYFLGTIVLVEQINGTLEIVDGQQRLATTALFIAVIRDYLKSKGDYNRPAIIESNYLFSKSIKSLESVHHLRLNDSDNPYFEKFISNTNESVNRTDPRSAKLLAEAVREARDFIKTLEKIDSKINDSLIDLLEYIKEKVIVVSITVSDTANAFAIFETLNDRGLDLSIADLLKNYLFGLSGDKIEEAKTSWVQIIAILSPIGDEALLPKFIHYYWLSSKGVVTQNNLFTSIKNQVQSKTDAIEFLKALTESARHFVAMQSAGDSRWTSEASKIAINNLSRIPLDQTQPLLLAVVSKFSERQVEITLKHMVSWTVRFHVAANTRTSQFREKLSTISQSIHSSKITTSKELYNSLIDENLLPKNAEFEKEFIQTSPSHALARYYLSELEQIARIKNGKAAGLKPNPSPDAVDLEHILPKTITDFTLWPSFNTESKSNYVGRLGNLAILPEKVNSKLGNAAFSEKRIVFGESAFLTTRAIADNTTWSPELIEDRQIALAKLATQAWPLL